MQGEHDKQQAVLVTGAAGFIGFHVARRLLTMGYHVIGIDSLNSYYDPALKNARLDQLKRQDRFIFIHGNLADQSVLEGVFSSYEISHVIHLAAQAGVRYSLENPMAYVESNLTGFMHVLEACRHNAIEHLVYASSSSVYGANTTLPFRTSDNVDHPLSLYAATKKSNELLAHSYSHLYRLPTTGLRFFTVYGPWGRPDMAMYIFTKAIMEGRPIPLFNHGEMKRDFTYIDDIVEGVIRITFRPAKPDPAWEDGLHKPQTSSAPYHIYNIGNHAAVDVKYLVRLLEDALGKKAELNLMPMQKGDVPATYADIEELEQDAGFTPSTSIEEGVENFVRWYKSYHH